MTREFDMAVEPKATKELTWEEAEHLVAYQQGLTGSNDPERTVQAFASDVIVRYANFPEMRGKAELKRFMASRFSRQKNYRLKKQLRAVSGNVMVCSWVATWEDSRDGRAMEGFGIELLTIEAGKIVTWEAVFNVWEKGASGSLPIV
jgi:nuclear transport factor 2 (NTF2) superfamily protein